MASACSKSEFIRDFSKEVLKSSAALFVGSGFSRPAGYIDWKGILKEAALDIGLDVDKEDDLISLAEYYVTNKKNRAKIDSAISEYFATDFEPTENHRLLASLPIASYWTTNYDQLLERTFKQHGMTFSVLTDDESLKKFIDGKDIILHKLHGDVERPQETVITRKDYEEFAYKHEILLAKLKGEMCSKTFLFLGYSFSDTDIKHILTRIRLFYKGNPPKNHYGIMLRVKKIDGEANEDYEYSQRKQDHHIEDLKQYGIQTVLVDNFSEITEILREVRHQISAKQVFISGAFEADESNKEFAKYAREISKWLIENGYHIHTGYGKSVGAEIVAGAFDACEKSKTRINTFNRSVFLYPFPYIKGMSDDERKSTYTELRKNAILKTHITIIINGTKKITKHSTMTVSDGVVEEGHLSIDQGNVVIPISVTGGAANQLWTEIMSTKSDYAQTADFQTLSTGTTFESVFEAIKRLVKGSST